MAIRGRRRRLARGSKGWNAARTKIFLETLAESCNVSFAAETAGVSSTSAYRRRSSDAAFRADWGQALATAYAALEMVVLRRALHGVERPVDVKDPEAGTMRAYDDRTALALLRMHQPAAIEADGDVETQDHDEAIERIMARLQRLRERVGGEVETKARASRLTILAWCLKR